MLNPTRKEPVLPKDPDFMESLARGLEVMRAFQHGRPSLSVGEIAALTNISRAAARRCLHTLSVLGYARGQNGAFKLTPKALSLGYAYLSASPVARVAQPVLEEVSARLHESCSMTVLEGDEIVYVARSAMQRVISVGLSVGSRLPVYCTSMGRVLLAFSSDADITAYLQRVKLLRQTPHTITEPAVLRRELQRIRAGGYALVDQELKAMSQRLSRRGRREFLKTVSLGTLAFSTVPGAYADTSEFCSRRCARCRSGMARQFERSSIDHV